VGDPRIENMTSNVVALFQRLYLPRDWSPQELAEFYRVEAAMVQAGLKVDTERGLSDEGEPWFVFCRADTGDVIVHIARLNGLYILAGPAYQGIASGREIRSLVRDLIARHPLVQTGTPGGSNNSNIYLHPTALLVAVVATAFFKVSEARALADSAESVRGPQSSGLWGRATSSQGAVSMDALQSAAIVSAIIGALELSGRPVLTDLENANALAHRLEMSSMQAVGGTDLPDVNFGRFDLANHSVASDLLAGATPQDQPAQMVRPGDADKPLAVVAVLWDLPAPELRHETNSSLSDTGGQVQIEVDAVTRAVLVVDLQKSNDELPDVAAAKVTIGPGSHVIELALINRVDHLPEAISAAIAAGTHTEINAAIASAPEGTSIVVASDLIASDDQALTRFGEVTDDGAAATTTITAADFLTFGTELDEAFGELQMAVRDFIAHTYKFNVVTTGADVVLYDPDAITHHFGNIKSVTWEFEDGTSLSLVGLAASLPQLVA
jgi:hypothetical protein